MLDICIQFIDLLMICYICFCISFLSACLAFHTLDFFAYEPCPRKLIIGVDNYDNPVYEAATRKVLEEAFSEPFTRLELGEIDSYLQKLVED